MGVVQVTVLARPTSKLEGERAGDDDDDGKGEKGDAVSELFVSEPFDFPGLTARNLMRERDLLGKVDADVDDLPPELSSNGEVTFVE